METAPVKYAIVDGAVEEGLLDFLNEVNPHTAVCMQNPYSRIWSRWPLSRGSCSEVEAWLRDKASPWEYI